MRLFKRVAFLALFVAAGWSTSQLYAKPNVPTVLCGHVIGCKDCDFFCAQIGCYNGGFCEDETTQRCGCYLVP